MFPQAHLLLASRSTISPRSCCSSPTPTKTATISATKREPSDFDQRFRWVTSFDIKLPIGKGQRFLGFRPCHRPDPGGMACRWNRQLATLAFYFTPQMSFDPSNTGFERPDPHRPTCNGNLPRGERSINNWFDINCFPIAGRFHIR